MLRAPFSNSSRRAGRALDDLTSDADAVAVNGAPNGEPPAFAGRLPFGSLPFSPGAAPRSESSSVSALVPPVADAAAPAVTIAEGASAEIAGASAQAVTFTGTTGTLKLDQSLSFTGQISGLAGSDAIDLADVNYGVQTQVTYLGNTTGGTLTITDGVHTANIALQGDYLSSTWTLSSDGHGGTIVVDPVTSTNWQELKVGAGGFITGLDIAPDDTMVIRTDTYGAYIWNGTQWQQLVTATSMPAAFVNLGVNQGVYEIQVASSNTNIMYMMYDGYVFKSTNKGTTWTQTSFAQVTEDPNEVPWKLNGQKMAIDPNNPNVVYVGTPQNGMFVTTDGGTTWQKVSALPVGLSDGSGLYPGFAGILFAPNSGTTGGKTTTIFASSFGNGVYESTNAGATWTKLSGGPTDVEYAAIAPNGTYYAIGNNYASLWRYSNGVWTDVLDGNLLTTVAIDPFNPSKIVVQSGGGNLNISLDGGNTWSGTDWSNQFSSTDIPWLSSAFTNNYMGTAAALFDQLVPNKLYNATGIGVWTTTLPQNFTWQTPITWSDQSVGIEQLVANKVIVAPGGKPVVASWDRAFIYLGDLNSFPTSYGPVSGAFAAGWSIDYASSNPSFMVGIADWWGNEDSGYSTDGGQTWHVFSSMPAFAGNTIGGSIAASSPSDIVWAPADGYQPYYTLNGGASWNPVNLPGVTDWSSYDFAYYLNKQTITADRVLSNTFYFYYVDSAGDNLSGVYKSTNGGQTWTQVYAGQITPFSNFNSEISSVPGEAGNLFFTGGQVGGSTLTQPQTEAFMRSTNGGASWTAVANVLDVSCFGFGAPASTGGYPSIYIVGYVNNVYGVWQSNDNAQSWVQLGTFPNNSLDQITTISGDPNIYGQVYLGFRGSGYAYLPAAPAAPAGPSVTGLTESPSTGDLNAGKTVTLTLNLSSAVSVAGGTPTLTLNDGGTATYIGGSGTTALTFSYTVGANDTNVASLAATAVNLNGATIKDGSGKAATLGLGGITQAGPQIDTSTAAVSTIAETPSSGYLNAGKTVTYSITLNEVVTVNTAGGKPTLALNDGGIATYVGGSGTNTLTFSYTVLAGQNTPDLVISGVNLNGATVIDGAGNAANFSLTGVSQGSPTVDTTPPALSSVAATAGSYNSGKTLTLTLKMSEAVNVTGTPTLTLNDGGTATYTGGSGSGVLTFSYTVASGQNTSGLAVSALNGTITDLAGNALTTANLPANFAGVVIDTTIPSVSSVAATGAGITAGSGNLGIGSVVTLTLNLNGVVTVAGGTPTLTLNDGGTATYTGGSGTNALTFSYTVAAGQNVADLGITAVNLNSATVKNGAGTAANLTGAVGNLPGTLQISTSGPSVSSVVASGSGITAGAGDLAAGSVVTLTVNLSSTVTVAGGTPTLTLNDGGTATYTGGSGSSALTFSYTVGAGQNTADLTVTGVNLNSATVKDSAGNSANLTGAVTNPAGTLQIDTTTPAISAISETPSNGYLNAGKTVIYSLAMNEVVTVNTAGGSPTLTFNDGGIGTYVGGSGTNTLTFNYTVLAGQNTPDLMLTSVNLNGAVVMDAAGNAANFSLSGVSQGSPTIDTAPPTVSSVSGTAGNYNIGQVLTLTLNMSEAVTVTGTPTLTLNDGGSASYIGGSGSSALTFSYTVESGQNTPGLAVSAVNGTITDFAGNGLSTTNLPEIFTGVAIGAATVVSSVAATGPGITAGSGNLGVGSVVTLTLNLNEVVTVAGGTPTLTLNDGGTATYTGGSGTNALTFSYTVAAGQNAADLAVTAVNLNSANVTDSSGNVANLSGAITSLAGTLQIDTTAPALVQVAASPGTGVVTTNHTVYVTLKMNEAVIVKGTPTLLLNDGGTATYDAIRSSAQALVFDYTVGSRQVTTDLNVSGLMLSNGSSIRDLAGNSAVMSGVGMDLGLRINTTAKGVVGPSSGNLTIAKGSELELFGASKANVTFSSGTGELKLDNSVAFTGRISGLTADDALDLSDISYGANTRASFSGNSRGGTLTVTDGSNTAKIALLGNYLNSGWTLSNDGNGGTVVVDPPLDSSSLNTGVNANGSGDIFTQRVALLVQDMASSFATSGVSDDLLMTSVFDRASNSNSFLAQPIQQHSQHA